MTAPGPTPATAYQHAPDIQSELTALRGLPRREHYLRRAAALDRVALSPRAERDEIAQAEEDASWLAIEDHDRHSWLGPISPTDPTWQANGSYRGYVRQEYLAWRRSH